MAHPASSAWTIDDFFAWQAHQSDRYELVNGRPLRMMTGATNAHNDFVINVLVALRVRLGAGDCRPFNNDCAVETLPGQIRRPDVGVECGPRRPSALMAEKPVLIVEVLSPTTRDFDTFGKIREYQSIAGLRRILLIEPNKPEVRMWTPSDTGEWQSTTICELQADIAMPEIGVDLPLREIYDGIVFPTELSIVAGM